MRIVLIILFLTFSTVVQPHALRAAAAASPERAAQLKALLDEPIPTDLTKEQLAEHYHKRVFAARELADSGRELNEIKSGISAVGPDDPASYQLYNRLANYYADRGSPQGIIDAREAALKVAVNPGQQLSELGSLTGNYLRFGDILGAKAALNRMNGILSSTRSRRQGALHQAIVARAKAFFNYQLGYLAEAASESRKCVTYIRGHLGNSEDATDIHYFYRAHCSAQLLAVLLQQGQLKEAGAYLSEVKQSIDSFTDQQKRRLFAPRLAPHLARAYIDQGLIKEAKELLNESLAINLEEEEGEESTRVALARKLLALIEMISGNWKSADEIFRVRDAGLSNYPQESLLRERPVEWAYALLRLGRVKDALDLMEPTLRNSTKWYDEKSIFYWEIRAFHALAAGANGQRESAIETLSNAVPKLLDIKKDGSSLSDTGILYSTRLTWLLDGYIALLADLHQEGKQVNGVDAVAEMYRLADLARGSKVQGALAAAILRASINDSELAGLIRKSQDLEFQILRTAEQVAEFQTRKDNPKVRALIEDAQARLSKLREQSEKTQAELKRKLPDYSELLSPKPLSIAETQKFLRPQEALISIYSTERETLVWSIPARGAHSFAIVDLPAAKIADLVYTLRKSLDPSDTASSQIPSFEYAAAYELFLKLLAPVESSWNAAKELIIVPHGALGQLPFSVFVTGSFSPVRTAMLFAEHRDAPWLLKRAAISYLPSVAVLGSLRRTVTQKSARSFVGFADPIFSASSASQAVTRGVDRRFLKRSSTSEAPASQANLSLLRGLPDTATEVGDIASILKADDSRDLFLGKRASEQILKSTDLTQYRTVMFATHGLTAGELPGVDQPALALSNPAVTGEKEDGLLMLNEILDLKLNADWIVLSACNTASSDGKAAEGVSGLGRAFFYAGAKALLVSHWPVETVSARRLTTEIFRQQSTNMNLTRAEALRQSSLTLMQQTRDGPPSSAFSYAHPMFWAPFVVVGDGGN